MTFTLTSIGPRPGPFVYVLVVACCIPPLAIDRALGFRRGEYIVKEAEGIIVKEVGDIFLAIEGYGASAAL